MGEYTGLVMFLWIVGAPTIGLLVLSLRDSRTTSSSSTRAYETTTYAAPRTHGVDARTVP